MPRAWLVLLLFTGACYSLSLTQEPTIAKPGELRAAAGAGLQVSPFAPMLLLGARVGMFERTDLRLKLVVGDLSASRNKLAGLEAGLGIGTYQGPRFSLVVLPHYRFYPVLEEDHDGLFDEDIPAKRRVHAAAVPALFVLTEPAYRGLFFGPTMHAGARDGRGFASVGGHLGCTLRLGPHVRFTPELSVLATVAGARGRDEQGRSQSVLTPGDLIGELGLGFTFGAAD